MKTTQIYYMKIEEKIATYIGFYKPTSGFDLKYLIYNVQCLIYSILWIKTWRWFLEAETCSYVLLNDHVIKLC